MPPGTGDVPLTVFQSLPVDGIVVVTSPQELVQMIVKKAYNMANMMHIPVLGVVENFSYLECPDCGKKINVFGQSHVDEAAQELGIRYLENCRSIRLTQRKRMKENSLRSTIHIWQMVLRFLKIYKMIEKGRYQCMRYLPFSIELFKGVHFIVEDKVSVWNRPSAKAKQKSRIRQSGYANAKSCKQKSMFVCGLLMT